MERIKSDIEAVFETKRTGCKVMLEGANTLAVYHCVKWNKQLHRTLRWMYPTVNVELQATSVSLSGFKILLNFDSNLKKYLQLSVFIIVCVIFGYVFKNPILTSFYAPRISPVLVANTTNHSNHTPPLPQPSAPNAPYSKHRGFRPINHSTQQHIVLQNDKPDW
jgi:hypothetical protein